MIMKHIPVLLDAVMDTLGDIHGRTIVDCTFGAGGYSRRFLESGANVIAFDRDKNVVDDAKQLKSEYGERFRFINSAFSEIANLDSNEFDDVVFDFGISSTLETTDPDGSIVKQCLSASSAEGQLNSSASNLRVSESADHLPGKIDRISSREMSVFAFHVPRSDFFTTY